MIAIHTGRLFSCLLLLACLLLLLFPSAVRGGARTALLLCGEKLIPALFPFLVLTSLLCESGDLTEKHPSAAAAVLGLLAGAPVGAEMTAALYRKGRIGRERAATLLFLSNAPSPAFLIAAVGQGEFGSAAVGRTLYAAQLLSLLLIGGVMLLRAEKRVPPARATVARAKSTAAGRAEEAPESGMTGSRENAPGADGAHSFRLLPALSRAIGAGASAALRITGAVVFFGSLSALVPASSPAFPFVSSFLELTCGCAACAAKGGETGAVLAAAAAGWSGLSVAAQVCTAGEGIPPGRYFVGKAASALLTPMIFCVFLRFFGRFF